MQRRSAAGRDRVDIGAREQQLRDDLRVAPLGGAHEGCERAVCGLRVGTLVEERGDAVAHPLARGRDELGRREGAPLVAFEGDMQRVLE